MKRRSHNRKLLFKESYGVSPDLAEKLNSVLADEFLASQQYNLAKFAMRGNKQHLIDEIAAQNGFDELDDHFKNLCEWMQSKGIKVVTSHKKMEEITNCTIYEVEDGDSTEDVLDKLIGSELEAIDVYENLIPETDLDLKVMLCGFLKDEREHLKKLMDVKDEITGGSESDAEFSEPEDDDEAEMIDESIETETIEGIPNWAATYIMYGDGLEDDDDIAMVDEFIEELAQDGLRLVEPIEGTENEFNPYTAFGASCDTQDWIAVRD